MSDPESAPRVLYVEDDRINLVLMEEVFQRLPGWRLDCAEDGSEALQMLAGLRPDLMLIDMNLPDMSGLDLLAILRRDARLAPIPCIAVSADELPEQVQLALTAGFADYWIKPIDVPRFAAKLQAWR